MSDSNDIALSFDFDKAVWDKQPLLVRSLGTDSNYYKFFKGIFDILQEHYLDEEDGFGVRNARSFTFLARQLFVDYASDKFLDEHGKLNGLVRKFGEGDEDYRDRLVRKLKLLYEVPTSSDIISYIGVTTGFSIEIEDSGLVGCINPDDISIEEVQQAGFSVRGEIPRLLHIYYAPNPSASLGALREELDKVMFSFVKYYLIERVPEAGA